MSMVQPHDVKASAPMDHENPAGSTILQANGLHFSAQSQGDGPVVLLLHGFPDNRHSFNQQLPALADAGYRAVAPTLRGYEPSSLPPNRDYQVARMAEDLVGWIDDLGQERVHLVGHDWGAVIGYAAAALAPDRLFSLTTLAMPHPNRLLRQSIHKLPRQLRNSWYMLFFQLRGVAYRVVEARDWALIEKLWRDWSPGWELPAEELASVKQTLSQPGVKRAALGYYRALFDFRTPAAKQTRQLLDSQIHVPTLALTGMLDGCMDTRLHDLTMNKADFPAGLRIEHIEGAGHFLHKEKPDQVNRLLLEWLTSGWQSSRARAIG